jgi:8-oxo-dGTP pyrophosphatase MutT (NUDIX family)
MADSTLDFSLTPADLRAAFTRSPQVEDSREEGVPEILKPAAVLVPVVDRNEGLTVLLTRRTDHLHDHPGQISFPGGRVDAGDVSPTATALREAQEEIGLPPEQVQLLGQLPLYRTGTGFEVTPVVGLVAPPLALALDPFEVAEAFEVPLSFLLDTRNHLRHSIEVRGRMREYWAMPYGPYYIWGATAGMIVTLGRQLRGT